MNVPIFSYKKFPQNNIKQTIQNKLEELCDKPITLQLFDEVCALEGDLMHELQNSGMIYLLDLQHCLPPKELALALDIRDILVKIQTIKFSLGNKIDSRMYQADRYPEQFARRWFGLN